jgi:hypothetical protein
MQKEVYQKIKKAKSGKKKGEEDEESTSAVGRVLI